MIKNINTSIICLVIFLAQHLWSEGFMPPSPAHQRPIVNVSHYTGVLPGSYLVPMEFECKELPGHDKKVEYWVLVNNGIKIRREPVNPCFKRPGEYAFSYQNGIRLMESGIDHVAVRDQPVEIQYFMRIVFSGEKAQVYASLVHRIITPRGFPSPFWQKRSPDVQDEIDNAWGRLTACRTEFGSRAEGFLCNGKDSYSVAGTSTDDIIAKELLGKDKSSFNLLELGSANGCFLISAHDVFNLDWHQLMGISALDHRPEHCRLPDSSYTLHNIERLDLLPMATYDLVISHMTWLYLKDPLSAFALVYERLKADGVMYIHVYSDQLLKQGVDLKELAEELKAQGFLVSLIEEKSSTRPGIWLVLRKTANKPILELPYQITGLTRARRADLPVYATYEHDTK